MPDWKCGASRSLSLAERDSWDGDAARGRIFELEQGRWKSAFLAYDTSAADLHTSYKLPFADVVEGKLVAVDAGLRAAASRLPGTDIPEAVKDSARSVIDSYLGKRMVRASFAVERSGDAVPGASRRVMVMTESPVRMGGGIARAAGARLDRYLRNPVVMWAHDYSAPPIGRALSLEVIPGRGISAEFEFAPPGVHPLADTVRGLWDAGFVNAASIGFIPEDVGREAEAPVYERWEMLEFSLVPIPRDADALRLAVRGLGPGEAEDNTPKGAGAAGKESAENWLEYLRALRGLLEG